MLTVQNLKKQIFHKKLFSWQPKIETSCEKKARNIHICFMLFFLFISFIYPVADSVYVKKNIDVKNSFAYAENDVNSWVRYSIKIKFRVVN